ncbi:MAG: PepSY domain-containing protein [Asticcacaulis sp.]|uniref:PepSY-associated TM helix domain-containing protein n=1 Tax=Asticcacaulis sp. TaxID=1872648 RepID=UPI0025C23B63|nr:PepSY domain-containing protein [Asticcacaulis sp.]MCA1936915.1 PepSY domain-containing protein [Asticcacaulis sp.]
MSGSVDESLNRARRRQAMVRAVWRWHFYAGLFCIPFIIILSITGSLYLFKPQIESAIDRPYDALSFPGPVKSITEQVSAASVAHPGAKLSSVEVRQNPQDATRVVLTENGEKLRLYVHPQTLAILKSVPEEQRFMAQVKNIHGELLSGKVGEIIVELAACWAIVMILTGLYLWWPRQASGLAGVLYPRTGMGKRLFWRDLHAVTGIYVSFFALFLLLSGLPWTSVWGDAFKQVRVITHTAAVKQDWSSGRAADRNTERAETGASEHADHETGQGQHAGHKGHTDGTPVVSLDRMYATVRALDLPAPVTINAPSKKVKGWTAQSNTQNRPLRVTLKLDPRSGQVLSRETFVQKHPIDQVVGYMIAAHEGHLFGWLNQALGVFTALFLITLCVSSIIMWLKRRPAGKLGAPEPAASTPAGMGLLILIVALGIFLPVLGISLIVVGALEFLVLRHLPGVRTWLGLRAA